MSQQERDNDQPWVLAGGQARGGNDELIELVVRRGTKPLQKIQRVCRLQRRRHAMRDLEADETGLALRFSGVPHAADRDPGPFRPIPTRGLVTL